MLITPCIFAITIIAIQVNAQWFEMEAGLNFLSLGYNIDIYKGVDYDNTKVDYTKHDFNFGFKSYSVHSLGQLQFGVIYKF